MGRYLPRDYEPIPDATLRPGADLVDVVRRIARNQNWIWANHAAAIAAFGHEPMASKAPSVVGVEARDVAYFAAPLRSATGSDRVQVAAYVAVSGILTNSTWTLRLYQLLPGESAPTAVTPYDDYDASGNTIFTFAARIRTGADPLRCVLRLIGRGTATVALETATVTWDWTHTNVQGETAGAWTAISQSYVVSDRSVDAALLRAVSNRTLGLVAQNPRPLYAHSFLWPRASASGTIVAKYLVRAPQLQPSKWATVRARMLVAGQNAVWRIDARAYAAGGAPGAWVPGGNSPATTSQNGAYLSEQLTEIRLQLSAAAHTIVELAAVRVTLASNADAYVGEIGCAVLGCSITQDAPSAVDLGLPGAETIPLAYQPLDDLACAPRSAVVAQNDRIGRRAGLSYLVKNLIWLAANRSAHTLVADWMHRTQHAGHGTNTAGDELYRNTTVFPYNAQMVGTWHAAPGWFPGTPGWADRTNPTNANELDASASPGGAGHHYPGDALMKMPGMPLTGGKIGGYVRTEVQFVPGSPSPTAKLGALLKLDIFGLSDPLERLRDVHLADTTRPGPITEWATLRASRGMFFGAATPTLRLSAQYYENIRWGLQVSLLSAYLYELPLTQADLDALA
jgi:hypothetical protein